MRTSKGRRAARWLWSLIATVGCASPAYYAPPDPPPVVGRPVQAQQGEIPPQVFTPVAHRARRFPIAEAAPMSALSPASSSRKCVAAGAVPEGRPGGTTIAKKKKKRGFVPYAQSTPKAKPSKPERTASKTATLPADTPSSAGAAAKGEAEERGPAADFGGDDDAEFAQSAPASEPPPPVTTAEDRLSKREERKARRKAKRDRGSAKDVPSSPASGTALEESDDASFEQPLAVETIEPQWPPDGQGWGEATFLSNDDTMSMSSPQRVRYAIENDVPLPLEHIRKHELLNAASFEVAPVERGHDFSVDAQIAPSNREDGLYTLALSVNGRPIGRRGRRNAAITLVVDRSGSMKSDNRMTFVKRGLLRMVRELKAGDIVNLVTFDHRVCVRLQNFVVGRDDSSVLSKAIAGIKPAGNTNLHAGLMQGYRLADAAYQPKYTNRVVVISDALANRGVTDPKTLSMVSDFYDARRIRLSGIGVGRTFDDRLLDELTEKGRGAYVFLSSEAHVEQVFGDGFTSLVETTANDVHYRLHLPVTMRMQQFYGEEASFSKADVQAIHFFADTSQVLLADVEAWQGQLRPRDGIMLEVEYQHPESGDTMTEQYAFSVAQMLENDGNVRKAEVLMHFAENLEDMVRRFGGDTIAPPFSGARVRDPAPARTCRHTQRELAQLARGSRDAEVRDVQALWARFCGRYGQVSDRPPRKQ